MRIRHKLLVVLLATSLVTSLLIGFGAFRLLRAAVEERSTDRMRAEAGLLAELAGTAGPATDLSSVAAEAGRRLGLRVTFIDAAGRVLGDSAREREQLDAVANHSSRPEIVAAAASGEGIARRRSETTGLAYIYVARRVDGDGPVRFARLALPSSQLLEVQSHFFWALAGFTLAVLLVLFAIVTLVVRRVSRPIERMSEAAGRMADGELTLDVSYDQDDEVGRLGAAMNRMKRSLVAKISEMGEEQSRLYSVIGGMREGLLLVGPDRRVVLANAAFRRIFGVPSDPAGRRVAEVIRHPSVARDLDLALLEGREIEEAIVRASDSGRSFELHVTPLAAPGGAGGALVLFFDITRQEALENIRRDFVANVSHELRTPLTSIKAFVETLLDGGLEDEENRRKFLEIIRKHAGRMEDLIDDLTDLSQIETGAVALAFEEVDAGAVAHEVADQLAHRHAALGVRVAVEIPSPFPLVADRRRLEQILVNLIDNAIKFSRPGGQVTVRGSLVEGRPLLQVTDRGVGIPSDSLEKVFHRFYRVDKARSRDVGGTGLGLAIVKHLMRLHDGVVRLESEVGRGSTFTLEFPPPST